MGQQIGSITSRCSGNEPALPLERTAKIKPRQQTARAKKVHYNLIKMWVAAKFFIAYQSIPALLSDSGIPTINYKVEHSVI